MAYPSRRFSTWTLSSNRIRQVNVDCGFVQANGKVNELGPEPVVRAAEKVTGSFLADGLSHCPGFPVMISRIR